MGGQRIGTVPATMGRGTPRGMPIQVNRGGSNNTVTVGEPASAGTVSAGRDDLAPAGTPNFEWN